MSGILLNTLICAEHPPATKSYLAQNVFSVEVEKNWSTVTSEQGTNSQALISYEVTLWSNGDAQSPKGENNIRGIKISLYGNDNFRFTFLFKELVKSNQQTAFGWLFYTQSGDTILNYFSLNGLFIYLLLLKMAKEAVGEKSEDHSLCFVPNQWEFSGHRLEQLSYTGNLL